MNSDLNRLVTIFDEMNKDGFDNKSHLHWGFYFIDKNENKLRHLFNELSTYGYEVQYLRKNEDDEWTLYITKLDILTPEKLHRRNNAFNELAERCEVSSYDGWDVEKIRDEQK